MPGRNRGRPGLGIPHRHRRRLSRPAAEAPFRKGLCLLPRRLHAPVGRDLPALYRCRHGHGRRFRDRICRGWGCSRCCRRRRQTRLIVPCESSCLRRARRRPMQHQLGPVLHSWGDPARQQIQVRGRCGRHNPQQEGAHHQNPAESKRFVRPGRLHPRRIDLDGNSGHRGG